MYVQINLYTQNILITKNKILKGIIVIRLNKYNFN